LSREEALVHNLAHEFRHFWQKNHIGKRGKVWGARKGASSERDADAYAIRKQRECRALHDPQDAMQIGILNWDLIEKDVMTVYNAVGVSQSVTQLVQPLTKTFSVVTDLGQIYTLEMLIGVMRYYLSRMTMTS
jgi:hypothetical protein